MPQGYNARQWNNVVAGNVDKTGQQADTAYAQSQGSRNQYIDMINGGQSALNTSTNAAMSSAMPQFRQAMQGVQETEIARGVGMGGLGTSYEGDLQSAFQRNIANAVGQQALGLYSTQLGASANLYGTDTEASQLDANRYMQGLDSQRDYETALANAKKKRSAGIMGTIGAIGGAALGSVIPGVGTAIGAQVGGMAGSAMGG